MQQDTVNGGMTLEITVEHFKDNDIPPQHVSAIYKSWACSYDEVPFVTPGFMCTQMLDVVGTRKDVRILDVACGTGLLAEQLRLHALNNIDGLDASSAMLEQARKKGVYTNYIQAMVGTQPDHSEDIWSSNAVANETYDMVVVVGAFGGGHLDHRCLGELFRMTKKGGHVMFVIRADIIDTHCPLVEPTIQELQDQGVCTLLGKTTIPNSYLIGKFDGTFYTLRKLMDS